MNCYLVVFLNQLQFFDCKQLQISFATGKLWLRLITASFRMGAKLPSRSLGISRRSGPSSVRTVYLPLLPLRWLVESSGRAAPTG